MRNFLLGCILLVACHSSSKGVAKRQKDPANMSYPYSCVYKNVGTLDVDSTRRKP
jgi:hypothetical protein